MSPTCMAGFSLLIEQRKLSNALSLVKKSRSEPDRLRLTMSKLSQSAPDCFTDRLGLPHETFVIDLHQRREFITLGLTQVARLLTVEQPPEPPALRFVHAQISRCQQVAVGKLLDGGVEQRTRQPETAPIQSSPPAGRWSRFCDIPCIKTSATRCGTCGFRAFANRNGSGQSRRLPRG